MPCCPIGCLVNRTSSSPQIITFSTDDEALSGLDSERRLASSPFSYPFAAPSAAGYPLGPGVLRPARSLQDGSGSTFKLYLGAATDLLTQPYV